MLKVRPDCENCGTGEKSWTWGITNPYEIEKGCRKVDSARIKELVFPDYQDKYEKAKRFWELYIEGDKPENKAEEEMIKWAFYRPDYYLETYKNKETYAECEATFHTYATIDKNGHWIAKGEMGWWCCSTETENQVVNYIKNYKQIVFDNADENDYITIVDCHI